MTEKGPVTDGQIEQLRILADERGVSEESFRLALDNDTIAGVLDAIESRQSIRVESPDEPGPHEHEVVSYFARIAKSEMPSEAFGESIRQVERLKRMNPGSPETEVVRNYLDWMLALPWSKFTSEQINLRDARRILDEDHAHRDKLKDLILDYLAVHILRGTTSDGSILCFVGPPGVGKTSFGRSIARAMGRKFVRVSLGGVHDEAEIRGHRRIYNRSITGPYHPRPQAGRYG